MTDSNNGNKESDQSQATIIVEYSAKKISIFSRAREKIVKKLPHIFHFQKWNIVQNCTFLGKKLPRFAFYGENLSKFELFWV